MRFQGILRCLASFGFTLAVAGADVADTAQAEIQRLGDDNSRIRDAATEALVRMAPNIDPLLEEAAKSDDPEMARRARAILKRRHLEIPATPAAAGRSPVPGPAAGVMLPVLPPLPGTPAIAADDPHLAEWRDLKAERARSAYLHDLPRTPEGSLLYLTLTTMNLQPDRAPGPIRDGEGIPRACARQAILQGWDAHVPAFLKFLSPEEDPWLSLADYFRATGRLDAELEKLDDPAASVDPAWRLAILRAAERDAEALRVAPAGSAVHARLALLTGDPVPTLRRLNAFDEKRRNLAWRESAAAVLLSRWNGTDPTLEDLRIVRGLPAEEMKLFALGDIEVAEVRLAARSPLEAFHYFEALGRFDSALRALGLDPARPDYSTWFDGKVDFVLRDRLGGPPVPEAQLQFDFPAEWPANPGQADANPFAQAPLNLTTPEIYSTLKELAAVTGFLVGHRQSDALLSIQAPLGRLGAVAPGRLKEILQILRAGNSASKACAARIAAACSGDDPVLQKKLGLPDPAAPATGLGSEAEWQKELVRLDVPPPPDSNDTRPVAFDNLLLRALAGDAPAAALDASRRGLALATAHVQAIPPFSGPPVPPRVEIWFASGPRPAVLPDYASRNRELFFANPDELSEKVRAVRSMPDLAIPQGPVPPGRYPWCARSALLATAAGQWDLALPWWQLLAEAQPAMATHRAFLAAGLRRQGQSGEAAALDRQVERLVLGDDRVCLQLANVCDWAGDIRHAESWRMRALRFSTCSHPSIPLLAGEAVRRGDWARAAAFYEVCSASLVNSYSVGSSKPLYLLRTRVAADVCHALDHLPDHREASLDMLRLCHSRLSCDREFTGWFFPALRRAGLDTLHDDLHEESWLRLAATLRRFPESPETWNTAAALATAGVRHLEEGRSFSERAVASQPEVPDCLGVRASVEAAAGRRADALVWSGRARAMAPLDPVIRRQYEDLVAK